MLHRGMGNEGSQVLGVEIEEKCIETTEGWTLHSTESTCENGKELSVFISPSGSANTGIICSLEKYAKNLMLHRHPNILRFVSCWKKSDQTYLATEAVVPLSSVLKCQTPLQICIGLHSILKAVVFLHEKAFASHNNLCCASIYVTPEGSWKLGGLQYLCRFTSFSQSFLQEARAHRHEKSVAPEEDAVKSSIFSEQPTCIDQYSFGTFAEQVLEHITTDDIPGVAEFRQICKKQLQNVEPTVRPKLSTLLTHTFFTHSFVKIHDFLEELPLKTEIEKQDFFRDLTNDLTTFPEELVASQLGNLLLARLVLLDSTAQQNLLPVILTPRIDNEVGLFSTEKYVKYVVPKLLQMFCVRDAQIRMLLLRYFQKYFHVFSKEQLKDQILPELLLGVKDTNDKLVSLTLRALADLVLVLGSITVIGGKRGKLFTDGRPKIHKKYPKSPIRENIGLLPERLSPDGGEDSDPTTDEETETWSDWDVSGNSTSKNEVIVEERRYDENRTQQHGLNESVVSDKIHSKSQVPDINTLDIKCWEHKVNKGDRHEDKDDFFDDMAPVITKAPLITVSEFKNPIDSKSKFDVNAEVSEFKNPIDSKSKFDVNAEVLEFKNPIDSKSKFDVNAEISEDGWDNDLDWSDINDTDTSKNDS